jgi:hypothetical protein
MNQRGSIITLVLVFGAIFLMLIGGLFGFIMLQHKSSVQKVAWKNALSIAEAGADYFRWKFPDSINEITDADIQDQQAWCTNGETEEVCGSLEWCGPYAHQYTGATGDIEGEFKLCIKPKRICNKVLGIQVKSIGSTAEFPDMQRGVLVKLASTSIAEYAYLLNDGVWAGEDRHIFGKYKSNNGIKMDGTNNSLVESAVTGGDWNCDSKFGCYSWDCPEHCTIEGLGCRCPGVAGIGGPKDLWHPNKLNVDDEDLPPTFPFSGITAELGAIEILAGEQGITYPPSGAEGYHLILNGDGTFDMKIITSLKRIKCYSMENGWSEICDEKIETYGTVWNDVPYSSDCGLIFIEDDLWIEGVVKGKVTIAADATSTTSVIINGNIEYATDPPDGSDSLAVITKKNILIPVNSPNEMKIHGIFVAQNGHFGRNHYIHPDVYWWHCIWNPQDCFVEARRDKLMIYGSIVSYGRVGTKWSGWVSGYNERKNFFDSRLAKDPPPLLPSISPSLEFISWEETK